MTIKWVVKVTANFERNLEDIKCFLTKVEAPSAFNDLLDELLETTIPNLEQFPNMGRSFLRHQARSVEGVNALSALRAKLAALPEETKEIREYVLKHHLLLYMVADSTVYLLAVRHQRQLSFDFAVHWEN